ncbi:MAG: hypothetical protein L6R35_005932 [Caloplaca aegaea]|nr:MAG: hypothetical protein L6R35_005932 [Caloplaca aegaea]
MSQMSESQDVEDDALNVKDTDSDWEYEYDDTETEAGNPSFYVTIDISSTSHQTPGALKSVPSQEANPAPTQNEQPQEGGDTPANQETPTIDPSLTNTPLVPNLSTAGHMHPHDRIQILDLHTQNPLISYRNRHLSPPIHHAAALPPQRIYNRYIMHQPHRPGCDRRAQSR